MQLALILGIVFAIAAVVFALQNSVTVTVAIALWSFQGSLALVLLLALGLGALIAGLLSTPTVVRGQWAVSRLGRQVDELERKLAAEQSRADALATKLAATDAPPSLPVSQGDEITAGAIQQ